MRAKTAWIAALLSAVAVALAATCSAQTSLRLVNIHPDAEKLEAALKRRGSLDVREMPLRDVVAQLKAQFELPIMLAEKSLTDAGVNVDTPVTRQLHAMPLESILELALQDLELDYMVHEGVILISTPAAIQSPSMMETRIYPVKDLVAVRPTHIRKTESRSAAQPYSLDFTQLIDLIETTIAPESWSSVGGPGAISEFDNAEAMVISQTRKVHREIEGLLATLRKVKGLPGIDSSSSRPTASPRIKGRAPAVPERRFSTASPASWQVPQLHQP